MKRIFLDTNFVLDLLIRDEFKADAQRFLVNARSANCKFYISFLTLANFAYVMRKVPKDSLYQYLNDIMSIFEVAECNRNQAIKAIDSRWSDFEDSLQYQCAIENRCDAIITRNAKDFPGVEIQVLSASEYSLKYF